MSLIDRAGWPFVAVAAAPAAAAALVGFTWFAVVLLALPIAIALFFRDPNRSPPQDPHLVISPADGRVMFAGAPKREDAPPGDWQQVTIFLSPLDVHINRAPVSGRVTHVEYVPGSFLPAYKPESSRNEHSEIWFDHDGVPVVARQVVGVLARRVVCRLQVGECVANGDRIGLMKFGSRMDVFVPPTATLTTTAGDRVRGGETVIAHFGSRR